MLYSLTANKASFHSIVFHPGLNVILGVKTSESTSVGTRNSVGKSSVLQIIDFCLGSKVDKTGVLASPELEDWAFTLELDLGGARVKVTRATADREDGAVTVVGDISSWPLEPDQEGGEGYVRYSIERWRMLLGNFFFNLPLTIDGELPLKPPSYRQLSEYFHRTSYDEATSPTGHSATAAERDKTLTYLFGLDWEYVVKAQKLDADKANANTLKKGATEKCKVWDLKPISLKKECKKLEENLEIVKQALTDFNLDPIYREKEQLTNELTSRIESLRRRIIANRGLLTSAKKSLESESADVEALESVYQEAGVVFSAELRRTLEEVRAFHYDVIKSRREFLEGEIKRLKKRISDDERASEDFSSQRKKYMDDLRTHGALDELERLRAEYDEKLELLIEKRTCKNDYENSKAEIAEIKEKERDLAAIGEAQFNKLELRVTHALETFKEITCAMYGTSREMFIKFEKNNGMPKYRFGVFSNKNDEGPGVKKMLLQAFDLSILEQQRLMNRSAPPMLHDGEIFVSTDERQRVKAIENAHRIALECDGQYITGMNDDMVPRALFSENFDFDKCVALPLLDKSPADKLFGFELKKKSAEESEHVNEDE